MPSTTRKKPYTPEWFTSPIDLPERRIGKMGIKHHTTIPGSILPIVGPRQAFLRGIEPLMARVSEPFVIHQLVEYHKDKTVGLWMTDNPEELNQIGEVLYNLDPYGDVLVGGLGLGILAATVELYPSVDTVTVVERSSDVIRLVADDRYHTVRDDIHKYLKRQSTPSFEYILLDTWAATSEDAWWTEVMPLRRTIRNRWGNIPKVWCWAEDIMLPQVRETMRTRPPHWWYQGLPVPMPAQQIDEFLANVGLPEWEATYGAIIDRTQKAMRSTL